MKKSDLEREMQRIVSDNLRLATMSQLEDLTPSELDTVITHLSEILELIGFPDVEQPEALQAKLDGGFMWKYFVGVLDMAMDMRDERG